MRRRSTCFALLAVLLHALAPLLAGAAPGAPVDHMELCTALGVVTVQVESGDAPASEPAAAEHCPICAFQAAAAVPAARAEAPCAGPVAIVASPLQRPAGFPVEPRARPRAPPQSS